MTTYDDSDYRFEPDAEYLAEHERRKAAEQAKWSEADRRRREVGPRFEEVFPHEAIQSEHWKGNRGRDQ